MTSLRSEARTALQEAYDNASQLWRSTPGKGGEVMCMRAREGVSWVNHAVGPGASLEDLKPSHGTLYLTYLGKQGYAPESVASYYGTFKRMIELTMGKGWCDRWPKPPAKPRRSKREAMKDEDIDRLIARFRSSGYQETADLACLLRGTGLRIDVEALDGYGRGSLDYTDNPEAPYGTLRVVGKGEAERFIPVVDPCARQVLGDPMRMRAVRRVPYRTHLDRWNKAVKGLGITSRLATPHAVRHTYATAAHRKSGGDLVLAQELLGHASPATTARYLHMDLGEKARALSLD